MQLTTAAHFNVTLCMGCQCLGKMQAEKKYRARYGIFMKSRAVLLSTALSVSCKHTIKSPTKFLKPNNTNF